MKNGSLVLFSSNDLVGCAIRCFQSCNEIPNNLKLSHVGILFKETEASLYQKTTNKQFNPNDNNQKYFVLESTGTLRQVLQGIKPQVQINSLDDLTRDYNGKIYVREPFNEYQFDYMENYGDSYEVDAKEMLQSVDKLNKKDNKQECYFCSELVARILKKQYGLDIITCNVIPEDLQPHTKEDDIFGFGTFYESVVSKIK